MSSGQSAVMFCCWGVKAGWLIPNVDKRVGDRCDPLLTRLLEMSIAHLIKRHTNVLLVHDQVTIIFVVSVGLSVCLSVCLFVCLCSVFLSRL